MPNLSGRENAMLSGMLLGLSRKQITKRIDAIIDFAELGVFFDHPLRTYSTGMRARLGFAMAIQVDPDVLLVDEVLGVGDEEFRVKSACEMKKLIKSDKTVILTSHVISTMKELCGRILWIENGLVRHVGQTQTILDIYTQKRSSV